jgi:peptidoglycan/xylan/chitin deacetylase (PgdA/CDA1 family)
MKNRLVGSRLLYVFIFLCLLILTQCQRARRVTTDEYQTLKNRIDRQFAGRRPTAWAERLPGVKTRLDTRERVLALTFDACGSKDDGYDAKLIDFLVKERVPATLFICGRWIDKNPDTFRALAANPLFEIENHGIAHKPCSVTGKSMYGIAGTGSVGEVVDEIELNARKIQSITGRKPLFYRSGTAYYDEVGIAVTQCLGYQAAGFAVLGDAGATYPRQRVARALLNAPAGSIVICHMNHPEKETAEGVMAAVPALRRKGTKFVRLSDYRLK